MVTDTSLLSYIEVQQHLGEQQQTVYDVLRQLPDASNSELSRALGWSINRVTPRVYELRQRGVVFPSGRRACSITGRTVIVWSTDKVRCVV